MKSEQRKVKERLRGITRASFYSFSRPAGPRRRLAATTIFRRPIRRDLSFAAGLSMSVCLSRRRVLEAGRECNYHRQPSTLWARRRATVAHRPMPLPTGQHPSRRGRARRAWPASGAALISTCISYAAPEIHESTDMVRHGWQIDTLRLGNRQHPRHGWLVHQRRAQSINCSTSNLFPRFILSPDPRRVLSVNQRRACGRCAHARSER